MTSAPFPEEQVRRLERSVGSPHVRKVAERLLELGYELIPPDVRVPGKKPENYLRFHDPARPGPAVGYLTPHDITFSRDRRQLLDEPGGRFVPSQGEVCFSHLDDADHGLEIAKRLKFRS